MTYILWALSAAIFILACGLSIAIKTAKTRGQKIKELEGALESARAEMQRTKEYQNLREEAQQNADEKKQTLRTGDTTADFSNSLDVLHGAGKNRSS